MSFILDALRKSESARQSLGSTSLAELPLGRRQRGQPWWVFAIAALLLINLIVLLLVLFRDGAPKPSPSQQIASAPVSPAPAPIARTSTSSLSVPQPITRSLADEAAPARVQYESVPRDETPLAAAPLDGPALVKRIEAPPANSAVTAAIGLPDLRIDMHVFAKASADRFVFINMHKYTEGQTLAEGPVLEQITTDGVILFYKGQQLRLERP